MAFDVGSTLSYVAASVARELGPPITLGYAILVLELDGRPETVLAEVVGRTPRRGGRVIDLVVGVG